MQRILRVGRKQKGMPKHPFSTPVPFSLAASHGCPVRSLEQAAPIPRQQAEAPRRVLALPACARLHRRQALARQPVRSTVAPLRAAAGQAQALSSARAERLLPAERRAAPAACPRPARWRRSQGSPAVAPPRPWLRLQLPPWPGARLRVDGDEPRADRSVRGRSASASGWQPVPLRASAIGSGAGWGVASGWATCATSCGATSAGCTGISVGASAGAGSSLALRSSMPSLAAGWATGACSTIVATPSLPVWITVSSASVAWGAASVSAVLAARAAAVAAMAISSVFTGALLSSASSISLPLASRWRSRRLLRRR